MHQLGEANRTALGRHDSESFPCDTDAAVLATEQAASVYSHMNTGIRTPEASQTVEYPKPVVPSEMSETQQGGGSPPAPPRSTGLVIGRHHALEAPLRR